MAFDPLANAVVTKLVTNGGPCGDGTEVEVSAADRHHTKITCSRCGAERTVKIVGGKLDRIGFARLENAVHRLHDGDA